MLCALTTILGAGATVNNALRTIELRSWIVTCNYFASRPDPMSERVQDVKCQDLTLLARFFALLTLEPDVIDILTITFAQTSVRANYGYDLTSFACLKQ